jgi:hypothetical protein
MMDPWQFLDDAGGPVLDDAGVAAPGAGLEAATGLEAEMDQANTALCAQVSPLIEALGAGRLEQVLALTRGIDLAYSDQPADFIVAIAEHGAPLEAIKAADLRSVVDPDVLILLQLRGLREPHWTWPALLQRWGAAHPVRIGPGAARARAYAADGLRRAVAVNRLRRAIGDRDTRMEFPSSCSSSLLTYLPVSGRVAYTMEPRIWRVLHDRAGRVQVWDRPRYDCVSGHLRRLRLRRVRAAMDLNRRQIAGKRLPAGPRLLVCATSGHVGISLD